MVVRNGSARKITRLVELVLMFGVVAGIWHVVSFYLSTGYLPAPFFYRLDDTFMDWFNTAYWSYNPGAYDEWFSVYPPWSFVFLEIFGLPSCYDTSAVVARSCDVTGLSALFAFFLVNIVLVYLSYRASDRATSIGRTVALALGMPMLFALERGNLVVPCFTFLVLGHGRLLKSTLLKWLAVAVTVNFKPYLAILFAKELIRRRWTWLEGVTLASILLYVVSFIIVGAGSPQEVLRDITLFSTKDLLHSYDSIYFSSSYNDLLWALNSSLPLADFVGSKMIESLELFLPKFLLLGQIGVLGCLGLSVLRPNVLPTYRLAGLIMSLFLSTTNPGGYSEVFLLFFVFFERVTSVGTGLAVLVAYVLCVPVDRTLATIAHEVGDSYLSSRTVGYDVIVTYGQVVRPGLLLLLGYGLVAASVTDFIRRPAGRQGLSTASRPIAILPG